MPWGICTNKPSKCFLASKKTKLQVGKGHELKCRECGAPLRKCPAPKKRTPKPLPSKFKGSAFKVPQKVKEDRADRRAHMKKIIGDDLPLLPDIALDNKQIVKSGVLMAPRGCCGFLWKPDGKIKGQNITYLGTTGFAPCVAFFLYDIAIGVCLVCHFDSTSLKKEGHNCEAVAKDLGGAFFQKVREIDPVSYFRCFIVTGFKPDHTSLKIVKGLQAAYLEIAKGAENSELVPVSRSAAGTAILHVWSGELYNVQGLDSRLPKGAAPQFRQFKEWTAKNDDCGVILDLKVPLRETSEYPSKYYQS